MISLVGTEMAGRMEGTLKDRNVMIVGSLPPVILRVAAGYGGEEQSMAMMKGAIFSREFDDIVAEYDQRHALRSYRQPNCQVVFAEDSSQNTREFAGRQRSEDEIVVDPAIGTTRIVPRTMNEFQAIINA